MSSKMPVWLRRVLVVMIALGIGLTAASADAHFGTGLPGGFASGFKHPFTGFDHMLAMVAVGLWGAYLGRPLIYVLPVIFPIMMVFGAIFGMYAIPLTHVEMGIAASVFVLGCCISGAIRAPIWLACLICGGFALFHGYSHGKELPSAADPLGYSAGFVLATGSLHIFGIALGLLNEIRWGKVITRGFGGMIAVAGCFLLYRTLAQ